LARLRKPDELLEECRRGDESAWGELVSRYENLVFSTARNAGLDRTEATDVFQQVWLELHRSLLRIRDPGALPKWLITTTRRIAYRHAITNGRWVHEVRDDMAGVTPAADEAIEALQQRQELEAALEALDDRCAEVLRMLFLSDGEVSYAEVSRKTGLSENSVGSLRTRCLGKLRKILEGSV
jgi:RNA polymerase sigma factor (sigma-70 family)